MQARSRIVAVLSNPSLIAMETAGLEADVANVSTQVVWILGRHLDDVDAVGLVNPTARCSDPVLAHDLLLGPRRRVRRLTRKGLSTRIFRCCTQQEASASMSMTL